MSVGNISSLNLSSIPNPDTSVLRPVVLASYLVTFIIGFTGNVLVLSIIAYYSNIRRKSVANYYIWNLSLADLLFILTLPFFLHNTFTEDWPFGLVLCKLGFVLRETNRFSSIFLLVALSWDRFIASFYNLSHLRTIKMGVCVCVVIWVLCGVISVPYLVYSQTFTVQSRNSTHTYTKCEFLWPAQHRLTLLTVWTVITLCLGLLLPFVMICASYTLLAYRLRKLIKTGTASSVKKPNRKMTQTVITVVLIFLTCQTPYYIIEMWSLWQQHKVAEYRSRGMYFIPTYSEVVSLYYVNSIAQVLVFISSSCNPVLYGLMNDNYRMLYRNVLCCWVKGEKAVKGVEAQSSESNAEMASVTYRFQITFHKPKYSRQSSRRSRDRVQSMPTENILLEERTTMGERLLDTQVSAIEDGHMDAVVIDNTQATEAAEHATQDSTHIVPDQNGRNMSNI